MFVKGHETQIISKYQSDICFALKFKMTLIFDLMTLKA